MQIREHSILFQKDGVDEFAKDLVEDFGMVVTEITPDGASTKDVESNDWKDEDEFQIMQHCINFGFSGIILL